MRLAVPILAAVLAGALSARAEDSGWTMISVDDLDAAIRTGDATVYDTNPRAVWEKRRVNTATWLDAKKFTADDLPGDKAAMIVFYCMNEH